METKAVIFDLFETLITEFGNGERLAKRTYNYMELLGLSNEEFKREFGRRQLRRMTGELKSYHNVVEEILARNELPFNKETIDHLYQERVKEKQLPLLTSNEDVNNLLDAIRSKNVKIGLISNCTEEEVQSWRDSKLALYFDDVIFSYDVGLAKPNKKIYLLSCERLGVKPHEVVFVGDGGSDELRGAHDAGMRVYHATWFNTYIESNFMKLNHTNQLVKELFG